MTSPSTRGTDASWSTREMSSAVHPSTLWPDGSTSSNLFDHGPFTGSTIRIRRKLPAVDSRVFSYDPSLPQPGIRSRCPCGLGMYWAGGSSRFSETTLTKQESPLAISHDIPMQARIIYQLPAADVSAWTAAFHF